jgi:hypothetical protein
MYGVAGYLQRGQGSTDTFYEQEQKADGSSQERF